MEPRLSTHNPCNIQMTNTDLYQFMEDSPILTVFLALLLLAAVFLLLKTVFQCWNRFMRHLNIRKAGWPPSHCDADGDFKSNE